MMVMGLAYASWASEFNVIHKIDTYNYDIRVKVKKEYIDAEKLPKSVFELNKCIEIPIKNKGTIAAYLDTIDISYDKVGKVDILNYFKYSGVLKYKGKEIPQTTFTFSGSDLSEEGQIIIEFDPNYHPEYFFIEPDHKNDYMLEIKQTFDFDKILDPYLCMLEDLENQQRSLKNKISNNNKKIELCKAEINRSKTDLENMDNCQENGEEGQKNTVSQLNNYALEVDNLTNDLHADRRKLKCINGDIEDIREEIERWKNAFRSDRLEIVLNFEMFSR